jgi:hypothetical protein
MEQADRAKGEFSDSFLAKNIVESLHIASCRRSVGSIVWSHASPHHCLKTL